MFPPFPNNLRMSASFRLLYACRSGLNSVSRIIWLELLRNMHVLQLLRTIFYTLLFSGEAQDVSGPQAAELLRSRLKGAEIV
jgi:hypothetical protein